jgi:uncharacterized membrane protein
MIALETNTETKLKAIPSYRITAIDFVRGLAIILMALDHASTFWNSGRTAAEGLEGYRPVFPDIFQFLIRFVTHWCAPTFIFLAGTSIVLFETKRLEKGVSQKEITKNLVIRGLILLFIEWTLIGWAFRTAPFYFGVLAMLGTGMIVFAFIRRLSEYKHGDKIILGLSLLIFSEPLIDSFILNLHQREFSILYWGFLFNQFPEPIKHTIQTFLFQPNWPYGLYPLDPWIAVMSLGYLFGRWLKKQELPEKNHYIAKRLAITGGFLLSTFFISRLFQGWPFSYLGIWLDDGVLRPDAFNIDTFFLLAKYPPSIVFLLWTLGGMCFALAVAFYLQDREWFQRWSTPIVLFGTTPLFFYSIHLYIYGLHLHLLDLLNNFSLPVTIIVWILGLLVLYPACLEFKSLKIKYPNSPLKYI